MDRGALLDEHFTYRVRLKAKRKPTVFLTIVGLMATTADLKSLKSSNDIYLLGIVKFLVGFKCFVYGEYFT